MVSSSLGEINLVVQPWAGRQGAGANAGARIRACDQIAATGVVRILDKAPGLCGAWEISFEAGGFNRDLAFLELKGSFLESGGHTDLDRTCVSRSIVDLVDPRVILLGAGVSA